MKARTARVTKKTTRLYCAEHGWIVTNPCAVCNEVPKEIPVPSRRNGWYYLPDVDHPLRSVTTLIGQVLAKPQLISWAAYEAAKQALMNPYLSASEAANAIYGKKKAGGERGTEVHDLIASGKYELDKIPESLRGYIMAYEKWEQDFPHQIIHVESVVYNNEVAGRLDRLVKTVAGKFGLIDYKTNNSGLYSETGLQLSAYKHMDKIQLEENKPGVSFNLPIDFMHGVLLRSDGTYSVREYNDDYEVFQSFIPIAKWLERS